jgi:hypothetical protein
MVCYLIRKHCLKMQQKKYAILIVYSVIEILIKGNSGNQSKR